MNRNLKSFPEHLLLLALLVVIIVASSHDVVLDMRQGVGSYHIVQEIIITLLAIAGMVWVLRSLYLKMQEIRQLRVSLAAQAHASATLKANNHRQLAAARRELAKVIEQQFEQWGLTGSEREIGMLLIKGLSLKEIAVLRETGEKTVRQQASSIYLKSGLNGRHSFSAWFIEDLL